MLTPFVMIYTNGVTDANYNRFWFGLVMTASCCVYTTRLPYQMIAEAVGRFKETRNSAAMEVILNIVVSLICAPFMGLNAMVVGALAGGLVRVANLVWVCNRKVLKISLWKPIKNYAIYFGVSGVLTIVITRTIGIRCENLLDWILTAVPVTAVVTVVVLIVSVIFNFKQLQGVASHFLKRQKNKKRTEL